MQSYKLCKIPSKSLTKIADFVGIVEGQIFFAISLAVLHIEASHFYAGIQTFRNHPAKNSCSSPIFMKREIFHNFYKSILFITENHYEHFATRLTKPYHFSVFNRGGSFQTLFVISVNNLCEALKTGKISSV